MSRIGSRLNRPGSCSLWTLSQGSWLCYRPWTLRTWQLWAWGPLTLSKWKLSTKEGSCPQDKLPSRSASRWEPPDSQSTTTSHWSVLCLSSLSLRSCSSGSVYVVTHQQSFTVVTACISHSPIGDILHSNAHYVMWKSLLCCSAWKLNASPL